MSLLNFLFRERAPKQEESNDPDSFDHAEALALVNTEPDDADLSEGAVEDVAEFDHEVTPPHDVFALFPDEDDTLDLERIRTMLAKIAEILGEEDDVDEDANIANLSMVDLSIGQLEELAIEIFKEGHPRQEIAGRNISVRIENLYDQLKTGRVTTTMSRLLREVPHEILSNPADALSKDEVSIPLHLAVTSVRPDELVSRTPSAEMEVGLADMPNLFSTGASGPTVTPSEATGIEGDLFGPASPTAVPAVPEPQPAVSEEPQPAVAKIQEAPQATPSAPIVPDMGLKTSVKEPLDKGLPLDDEVFARTTNVHKPIVPEPESIRAMPPVEPPAPAEKGGFSFEFNEDATPFRRADEVPVPASIEAFETAEVVEDSRPAEEESVAEEPIEENDVHSTVESDAVEAGPELNEVLLCGVDINEASLEALTQNVEGLGTRLAEKIVNHREQIGVFTCPADLRNVPGVGPMAYERLVGESWSEEYDRLKEAVEFILGTDPDGLPDFRKVADRFCESQGFTGCMIVHTDGHVLASVHPQENADMLGAIAPQIFKKAAPYAEQLGRGELNPMSLVFGGEVITLARSGDVLITAIHQLDQLEERQLRLLQFVGAELEARMDHVKA